MKKKLVEIILETTSILIEPFADLLSDLRRFLFSEFIFWIIIGFLLSGRFWIAFWDNSQSSDPDKLSQVIARDYSLFVIFIASLLLPYLFSQIFGTPPFGFIKEFLKSKNLDSDIEKKRSEHLQREREWERRRILASEKEETEVRKTAIGVFDELKISSKEISEKIYNRAGVYLFVGVIIAFSGLLFFYFQSNTFESDTPFTTQLFQILPRFGILFFIEFIAFFFLRQYRTAMDEYRYFEAVKRRREENYALIRLMLENGTKVNVFSLLEKSHFYSDIGKLTQGETTQLIEEKKLSKEETRIFEKIIEAISVNQVKIGKTK